MIWRAQTIRVRPSARQIVPPAAPASAGVSTRIKASALVCSKAGWSIATVSPQHRRAALMRRISWHATSRTESLAHWQETDFRSGNRAGHDALNFNAEARREQLNNRHEYCAKRTRHDPDRLPGTSDPVLRR